MTYQEIKTFRQRCENRPTHPAEIQLHLHEEIAELRHYIEMHIHKQSTNELFQWDNNNAA